MSLFFAQTDPEIILNTASQLLEVFRKMCPYAVEDALASLRNGQPAEHAGRIIMAAIQMGQAQFQQEASEKQQALQNSINDLTGQLRDYELHVTQTQSENEVLQSTCEILEIEITSLRETITLQNRILARQQRQLQSLLGNTSDDESS
jgi:peptidoglycan hydrolase CwlO-like protein